MSYTEYWVRKIANQQITNQILAEKARSDVREIVDILVNNFHAQQIILFGSLVKGKFSDRSDIDLAVAGIPKQEYFAAVAAANQLTQFWVDLKPLEDLEPHFRHRVLTTGECIYRNRRKTHVL
jgi:uncharacterized protein